LGDHIEEIPWGTAQWIAKGDDLTLVGFGPIVYSALQAAALLQQQGYSIGVVNARFVEPLDEVTLSQVAHSTRAMVTLEEHTLSGGFGSRVLEWASRSGVHIPLRLMGIPDEFVDHGPPSFFLEQFQLTPEGISKQVEEWLRSGFEHA
jgi:1-deoxy-D-xylulose-5-phosphate synthase